MADVNALFATATLIVQMQGGSQIGSATGFFYTSNDDLYLVTNRHVVRDETKNHKPDALLLYLHTDPKNIKKNQKYRVDLYENGERKWYQHPKYPDPPVDISVIPLDQDEIKKKFFVKAISDENFLPKKYVINPGQDVMAVGFPLGFYDNIHNLPIVRSAMISSAYGVDFAGEPFVLIDGTLHNGMSGSAVWTKPETTWVDDEGNTNFLSGSPSFFIGVHSATLSRTSSSGSEPLDLGTVWYARLLKEIVQQIESQRSTQEQK